MRKIAILIGTIALLAGVPTTASATIQKVVASWSQQCTSPSICGTEFLGGEWGHGTFVRDTVTGVATGEVEVAFAFHDVQGSGPLHATSHLKTHVTHWSIGAGFDPAFVPNIVFDDYYSTFTGGNGLFFDGPLAGPPVDSEPCFIGCPLYTEIPAVSGHWTETSFFGVDRLPGFTYQAQVKVS